MYLYKKAMELSEQQFSTYSSVAQAPQYTREKKKKKEIAIPYSAIAHTIAQVI